MHSQVILTINRLGWVISLKMNITQLPCNWWWQDYSWIHLCFFSTYPSNISQIMLTVANKLYPSINLGFNKFRDLDSQTNSHTGQTGDKDRLDRSLTVRPVKVAVRPVRSGCALWFLNIGPFSWKCLSDILAWCSLFESTNPEFSCLDKIDVIKLRKPSRHMLRNIYSDSFNVNTCYTSGNEPLNAFAWFYHYGSLNPAWI
jgi:hypothetical protein